MSASKHNPAEKIVHATGGNSTHTIPTLAPPPPSVFSINGWRITTQKLPILKAGPIEEMTKNLRIPPPEMIFGDNYVRVEYLGEKEEGAESDEGGDKEEEEGEGGRREESAAAWKIEFDAFDALDRVDKTGERMLKVAHSHEWQQSRLRQKSKKQQKPSSASGIGSGSGSGSTGTEAAPTTTTTTATGVDNTNDDVQEIVNPFDWTYTTDYQGTTTTRTTTTHSFLPSATPIPIDLLKRPDPILFFDDVMLYEDELADNGISMLSVKIRVMDERLLLLARFFLRLDGVLLRLRDTRVYVEFATKTVIRDYVEKEEPYEQLKEKLSSRGIDPAAAMRDSNEVADSMTLTGRKLEAVDLR